MSRSEVGRRLKTSRTARYSVIEDVAEAEEILAEFRDEMLDEIDEIEQEFGPLPNPGRD